MSEEEFEEKYKEVIDIINNTRTSLMVEDFVEEMYLKIKQQQKEIEYLKEVKWYYENSTVSKDKIREIIKKYAEEDVITYKELTDLVAELNDLAY